MLESITSDVTLQFFFLQYGSCKTDRGHVMISIQNFSLSKMSPLNIELLWWESVFVSSFLHLLSCMGNTVSSEVPIRRGGGNHEEKELKKQVHQKKYSHLLLKKNMFSIYFWPKTLIKHPIWTYHIKLNDLTQIMFVSIA